MNSQRGWVGAGIADDVEGARHGTLDTKKRIYCQRGRIIVAAG